jgi:hypothetical protein
MILDRGSIALRSRGSQQKLSAHAGHAHFWERALSRRQFCQTAAGLAAGAFGAGLISPLTPLLYASGGGVVLPNPIPGGIQPFGPGTPVFHVFLPDPNNPDVEPSTITDFNGRIGTCEVQGTGIGTMGGTSTPLNFDCDVRFMDGTYVGVDAKVHHSSFVFI